LRGAPFDAPSLVSRHHSSLIAPSMGSRTVSATRATSIESVKREQERALRRRRKQGRKIAVRIGGTHRGS